MVFMATGDVIVDPGTIIAEVGKLGKWIQAIGLAVVIWIIIQIVNYYFSRKRMKAIEGFQKDIIRIERKIDELNKQIEKRK